MRENKLYDVIKIFSDKLDNTYIDFIYNYAKQHGTLEIGFGKDDKCPLPDFDFSFNIETLDNIKIHVFFHNSTKELKVMCGKKDEFDISETKFGSHLIETIQELPENILYNEPKILEDNIRKNWEIFQKLLHKQIYDMIYDEVKDDIKHGIDDLPISCYTPIDLNSNKDLYRFYFRGVNFEGESKKEKIKAYLPVLSVLLEDSLEKSFDIAESAYVRGFNSGKRSMYDVQKLRAKDYIFILYCIFVLTVFFGLIYFGKNNYSIYECINLMECFNIYSATQAILILITIIFII